MLTDLFEWLKGVVIFVVVCEMTLSFAPSHVFKKYIKPFAGLLIILRITVFLMGHGTDVLKLDMDDIFKDYQISLTKIANEDYRLKNQDQDIEDAFNPGFQKIEIENIHLENIQFQE